jgi:hypothetical protein
VHAEDMRVLQAGGGLNLALEALGPESRSELGVEDFEGDRPLMPEIAREVDRGHAAAPQLALEHVAVTQGIN